MLLSATVDTAVHAYETEISSEEVTPESKTEQVTLYDDGNKSVTAEIPTNVKEDYLQKLQEPTFRQNEIAIAQGYSSRTTIGDIGQASVTYFNKSDVIKMVDSLDNGRDWLKFLDNPFTNEALNRLSDILLSTNLYSGIANFAAWAANDLKSRQVGWWQESLLMIARGDITAVKMTITPNTSSDYPKVYRTLERV